MPYRHALVTGGAGFIGSHLVDALIRRRIRVSVVDDLSTGRLKNLNPNAVFFKRALNDPKLPRLVWRLKPDVVFHLAAQIDVRKSVSDPAEDARTNILGTLELIQSARAAGVKKFIFSSSGGAVYPNSLRPPYSEKIPADPLSPYGIAKRAGEMYLAFAQAVHGLPFVALRYANVYGPRQRFDGEAGVVAIFADRLRRGRPVILYGTGAQTRDFVFVEDVVRANLLAMQKQVTGIFNIGTGKETDIKTLFRKLKKLAGSDATERYEPTKPGEVMRSALDCRKAREVMGWRPEVRFDDGLRRTWEWLVKASA